jgi:hypothetical protein
VPFSAFPVGRRGAVFSLPRRCFQPSQAEGGPEGHPPPPLGKRRARRTPTATPRQKAAQKDTQCHPQAKGGPERQPAPPSGHRHPQAEGGSERHPSPPPGKRRPRKSPKPIISGAPFPALPGVVFSSPRRRSGGSGAPFSAFPGAVFRPPRRRSGGPGRRFQPSQALFSALPGVVRGGVRGAVFSLRRRRFQPFQASELAGAAGGSNEQGLIGG